MPAQLRVSRFLQTTHAFDRYHVSRLTHRHCHPHALNIAAQAYNAERAGAQAVIVMDNIQEQLLTMSNPEERPEIAKLKADVSIPTALIQKVRGAGTCQALPGPEGVCGSRWPTHACSEAEHTCITSAAAAARRGSGLQAACLRP